MRRTTFVRVLGGALLAAGVALTMAAPASGSPATASAAPSVAELSAAQSQLDAAAMSRPSTVTGWYVDSATKSLVVSVHGSDQGVAKWASGLGAGAVKIEHVAEAPKALWNIIGGQAITTGGARCSAGFNARLSSGARYVITAGHCTNLGGTWSGVGGTIGPVAGSSFPGNDFGAIYVSSSAAASTPLVDRYSSGSDVTVTGPRTATYGLAVCRSGSTTGWHCGSVTGTNQTVCYSQGCVYQMIRTNVCAEPGDSGGSLVTNPGSGSRVQAVGLTSGGSGNCSSGGTTYFQPITEPLSVWGLTLYTG
ncbi:MAG: S1 family peptidase [Actinophytocola sp.]|uniref:S1 family peptidase n=1 Tax=Actinophytocola sp. TaxID=1872138 RepID=UPI0013250600|nr:S1 family peptidase [Actinophytocola sp.]MPZ84972.1 S1 family peptidase [Actinophytocola sp.]